MTAENSFCRYARYARASVELFRNLCAAKGIPSFPMPYCHGISPRVNLSFVDPSL
jgi:hypothetical protein